MNIAVDTNVLAYAEGTNGEAMQARAVALVERLVPDTTLLPIQTLGELFSVLVRKAGRSKQDAAAAVQSWGDTFPLIETSPEVMLAATDLSRTHGLSIWDAVVLSAAAEARCRFLLSEDLQDGFTWRGVTVANPFAPTLHPLLQSALEAGHMWTRTSEPA
jgi:predicted nucleic acid-binding protein